MSGEVDAVSDVSMIQERQKWNKNLAMLGSHDESIKRRSSPRILCGLQSKAAVRRQICNCDLGQSTGPGAAKWAKTSFCGAVPYRHEQQCLPSFTHASDNLMVMPAFFLLVC